MTISVELLITLILTITAALATAFKAGMWLENKLSVKKSYALEEENQRLKQEIQKLQCHSEPAKTEDPVTDIHGKETDKIANSQADQDSASHIPANQKDRHVDPQSPAQKPEQGDEDILIASFSQQPQNCFDDNLVKTITAEGKIDYTFSPEKGLKCRVEEAPAKIIIELNGQALVGINLARYQLYFEFKSETVRRITIIYSAYGCGQDAKLRKIGEILENNLSVGIYFPIVVKLPNQFFAFITFQAENEGVFFLKDLKFEHSSKRGKQ